MNKRIVIRFILLAGLLTCMASLAGQNVSAARAAFEQTQRVFEQTQRVPDGTKISVRSHYGRVEVRGWGSDEVKAVATWDGSNSPVNISITQETTHGKTLLITTDIQDDSKEAINLVITVPYNTEINSINTIAANVTVERINNAVTINTESGKVIVEYVKGLVAIKTEAGDIEASDVGSLKATTQRGKISVSGADGPVTLQAVSSKIIAVEIKGNVIAKINDGDLRISKVEGSVDVVMTGGPITLNNIGRDVQIFSINSGIGISCVKGNVEVNNVSGNIWMGNISGNVDSTTAVGEVSLRNEIRPQRYYRLKSHSGSILMAILSGNPGFTATLASYTGEIQTDFELLSQPASSPRRLIGRYGDGQAEILLDSFSGKVRLTKAEPPETNKCLGARTGMSG